MYHPHSIYRAVYTTCIYLLVCIPLVYGASAVKLVILAGAETHAMRYPCDCPDTPGGGLAPRAVVLDSMRARYDNVLVLDAGGFAAGGIYDTYTRGPAADSLRTRAVVAAMARMDYDAVCPGDEEMQYAGGMYTGQAGTLRVPLVCANCTDSTGASVFPRAIVKDYGDIRIGITGITTRERFLEQRPGAQDVVVQDPLVALEQVWDSVQQVSDYQFVLSHCGEDYARVIADSLSGCDLIVNGHRKSSTQPLVYHAGVPIAQFGFQGKWLSAVHTVCAAGSLQVDKAEWIPVGPFRGRDRAVTNEISAFDGRIDSLSVVVYDLYLMAQCPYGRSALKEFTAFIRHSHSGSVFPRVWFIGTAAGMDSLVSLHGPAEVREELTWLAIKHTAPAMWQDFLYVRSHHEVTTDTLIQQMGIDTAGLQRWIRLHGRAALRRHYQRSTRLGVSASPTLLVNNTAVTGPVRYPHMARLACEHDALSASMCDSLPSCLSDEDCRKDGMVGECVQTDTGDGECVYTPAQPCTLTVITAPEAVMHPEKQVMAFSRRLFPGLSVREISYTAPDAHALLSAANIDALPWYRFGPNLAHTVRFEQARPSLVRSEGGFVFDSGAVAHTFFYTRTAAPGTLTIAMDPLFSRVGDVVHAIRGLGQDTMVQAHAGTLVIQPLGLARAHGSTHASEERENIRERIARRWCALQTYYPDAWEIYLRSHASDPDTAAWDGFLDSAGIDPHRFASQCSLCHERVGRWRRRERAMGLYGPVHLVVENRERIDIPGADALTARVREVFSYF
jgi:hypothetical protein